MSETAFHCAQYSSPPGVRPAIVLPSEPTDMVLSTEWSQVEVIDLLNDGNGLGFILVGGKSTGVVIKALTPGTN